MKKSIKPSLAVIACLSIPTTASADAILHAFNWHYSDVTARAEQIAHAGYKKVLISPAMKSRGDKWWARYQPLDFRVIDSPIGNKQDLQNMINALAQYNVDVYADVVMNHMANESLKQDGLNYPGSDVIQDYQQRAGYYAAQTLYGDLSHNQYSSADFHPAGCITDWDNPGHVQYWRLCGPNGDTGLPDLEVNPWVIDQQRQYLAALKSMGVKGFRVDAVKHMSLHHINQIFTPQTSANMHIFGEVITGSGQGDSSYDGFLVPYLNGTNHSAYDFPLFSSIRRAFSYNGSMTLLHDPKAYGQALESTRAITFTVTHDIPNNADFRHQILDPKDEELAYAYVLGRDGGVPLIYSDELPDSEDQDNGRWANVWNDSTMVKMLSFHNTMQGQAMTMVHSDQCTLLFKRGKQGVVGINKCGESKNITVDTYQHEFNWHMPYKDVLSGSSETVSSRYHTFELPPRTAKMLKL
ncbi:Alpha-amylase [Vibrio nigripulchritudo SO65]|uniref:alpha-amylase family protein n=1 Tax=Vibrio nigripulchritudo TaxID=28173 RepID=UPI0003B1FC29|nr:alpha-amylase family protein [Vibrio nigripulchritudo]CCN34718.1 Alpha-amylase [Vibrio nigripulchritudo AM115]CCN39782.1 Alpha-amylase [Vibrio nigripulchritudo FTn2]CCN67682.1 Alpha-amylase [Vibrio nigripulchritudo POn4]CCN77834.1 Alpha-amylase [Vibrio nigripulchritudo SO65]